MKKFLLFSLLGLVIFTTSCNRNKAAKYIPEDASAVVVIDPIKGAKAANKDMLLEYKKLQEEQLEALEKQNKDLYKWMKETQKSPFSFGISLTKRIFFYVKETPTTPEFACIIPLSSRTKWEKSLKSLNEVQKQPLFKIKKGKHDSSYVDLEFAIVGWNDDVIIVTTSIQNFNRILSNDNNITKNKDFKEFLRHCQTVSVWCNVPQICKLFDQPTYEQFFKDTEKTIGKKWHEDIYAHAYISVEAKGKVEFSCDLQFTKLMDKLNNKQLKLTYEDIFSEEFLMSLLNFGEDDDLYYYDDPYYYDYPLDDYEGYDYDEYDYDEYDYNEYYDYPAAEVTEEEYIW